MSDSKEERCGIRGALGRERGWGGGGGWWGLGEGLEGKGHEHAHQRGVGCKDDGSILRN